ncbi:truncated ArsR family transcriptional regulator [Aminobacter sp. Y103A]|nr:truncated ArsR family transcriptional regulator [Aminobacter sp. SS-2016]
MDANDTIDALAALAQTTRLEAFRQMAAAEPDGIAAGDLARRLDVPC